MKTTTILKILLLGCVILLLSHGVVVLAQTVTARIIQNRTVWANYNFKAFCDGVPLGEGKVGVEFTYGGDCKSFEIKEIGG